MPVHRKRQFDGRPWWHEQVLTAEPTGSKKNAETRKNYSRIPEQTDEQLREIIANTYGQIALVDHQVGRLMEALSDQGLAENTIVIYSSDHGDWLGDHGLILKGPMHYDGLLTVPLIMRGPNIAADTVCDEQVSTLDLSATFLDYGEADAQLPQHGSSLRPVLEQGARRDYALNEWELLPTRTGVPLSLQTVRTKTAKLTIDWVTGAGEMYDLNADPHELVNLFDDDTYADLRSELTAMLKMRPDDMRENQVQVGMA